MVFLKEFFTKVDFEKNQQTTKKYENYPGGKELDNGFVCRLVINMVQPNLCVTLHLTFMPLVPGPSTIYNISRGTSAF